MPYNSVAKTLRVTHLHLIEDQWIMLALDAESARYIIKPICEDKFLLWAKEELLKKTS